MKLLLDTNVVSKIISGKVPAYRKNVEASLRHGDQQFTSVIVYHEMMYGAAKTTDPAASRDRILRTIGSLAGILDFTVEDAEIAAGVRATLAKKGAPIGPFDVLIASQALRIGAAIVTNNVREFSRIESLKVIDWNT